MIRSCKNTSLNHPNAILFILAGFIGTTIITGGFLTNSTVSADNASASDSANASVIVPMACTMTGTNTNSHNTEIVNGTYTADIGTTTLKAFCNDNNGFAIYAAGFTGDEVGGTNSNKLVGTAA